MRRETRRRRANQGMAIGRRDRPVHTEALGNSRAWQDRTMPAVVALRGINVASCKGQGGTCTAALAVFTAGAPQRHGPHWCSMIRVGDLDAVDRM